MRDAGARLASQFNSDPHPGAPRILFVGLAHSSHTRSWLEMLEGSRLNVRLFGLQSGAPPDDLAVRSYVTTWNTASRSSDLRRYLIPRSAPARLVTKVYATGRYGGTRELARKWLARIVREWRPDVIHTPGIVDGAGFYFGTRTRYGLEGI